MYSLFSDLPKRKFYPDRTLTPSGKVIQLTDSILLKPTKEFLVYISAIIIQAYWRGFKVRNDAWYDKEGEKWLTCYENSAAKRIQKIWREYKSRKVNTKPAIYSVLHIEHDQVWIIDQEGVFLKKTPSPSELPKPPEKWLIA